MAALTLATAATAHAEATSLLTRFPTSGLDQPAASAALDDGPASIAVNPAGLGFQRGLALRYLHETGPGDGGMLASAKGDGLYLGDRFFGFLGFGVSMEWVRPKGDASLSLLHYRRTSWGLTIGSDSFSLGGAAHVFTNGALDDRASWDVGLMARPVRFLSVGFTIKDLDGQSFDGEKIPRQYVLGVGARPFGDWLTLAVDAEVLGSENRSVDHGFEAMNLGYTARVEVIPGLRVLASLTHRIDAEVPLIFQTGLALDTAHLGLDGTPLIRTRDGSAGFLVGAELRAWERRGLDLAPHRRVAVVDLTHALSPASELRLFPSEVRDPMVDFVAGLDRLAKDRDVGGVILEIRSTPDVAMGKAYEIRQAISEFRQSGKPIAVLLFAADDATYFLASAADRVYATPDAALFVNGFSSRADFLADTLKLIGVTVDVAKVGAYKNAPDALTRSSISDEQKEVIHSMLDDVFPRYVDTVAASRNLSPARFRALVDTGVLTSQQALEGGLIDRVLFPDELAEEMRGLVHGAVGLVDTRLEAEEWTSWGPAPEIAVIPIEGTITAGHASGGLVQTTGARSVVAALESAARDPEVRAIVLRIDSGGGDAGGSQLIWRAVVKAREKKPVIATMSDAAASGGYLAAVGADRIFAAPDTVTGSIGIFWIKPSFEGLLHKLEIGTYKEKRGENADISSILQPWTPGEQAAVQAYVDSFYKQFVEATAGGRHLDVDQVDAVARGRVWTGAQAKERNLVDEIGGLADALRFARAASGLTREEVVRYRIYRPSASLLRVGAGASLEIDPPPGSWIAGLPEPVRDAILAKIPLPLLVSNPSGLWALAPFDWRPR
ncbi:signal peptide peptidase SppA, 36K type [Vulgatibacter incomptus]|uniref:Signal peptide peptidase SppA, 36K type n=1 Tax=Vulgatibacter incomptus TaxID=1391653 RepID=A0A0K1PG30_9BACT|nr:signal peptide peptidase SppA, 36K type [Vulgatibacter incomptus]